MYLRWLTQQKAKRLFSGFIILFAIVLLDHWAALAFFLSMAASLRAGHVWLLTASLALN